MSDANRRNRAPDRGARVRRIAAEPDLAGIDLANETAVITGNRAGVVESANEGWTRITGFPLDETLEKPITHFLDAAGIEVALVEFVGQHFLEGRSCTVEFPFHTFDQREIQVHLEVEPIHDPRGELVAFRAVAHDITERWRADQARSEGSADHDDHDENSTGTRRAARVRLGSRSNVSIADGLLEACRLRRTATDARTHFDLDLAPDLPPVETDAALFGELVAGLLDTARRQIEGSWGWVSVLSGQLASDRSHVSRVHPIVARFPERLVGPHLFVEIHASEATLDLRDRSVPRDRLMQIADALSATLHFDDTPGCGHQSLLLIPVAPTGGA